MDIADTLPALISFAYLQEVQNLEDLLSNNITSDLQGIVTPPLDLT